MIKNDDFYSKENKLRRALRREKNKVKNLRKKLSGIINFKRLTPAMPGKGEIMRLTSRLKKEIEKFALGSMYRLNASTADVYVFSLYRNKKGKIDFEGGWDWSHWTESQLRKNSTHAFYLKDKVFTKI